MRNSQQTTSRKTKRGPAQEGGWDVPKRCVKCDHIIDDPQVEGDERCAACADPGDEPALPPVDPGEYWRDVANRLQNDVSNLDQAVVNQDRKIEELEADCARHIETALRWKRRHDEDTTRLRGERDKAGLAHIKTRKRVRKAEGILLKAHDELGDSDGVLLDALNALTPPKGG